MLVRFINSQIAHIGNLVFNDSNGNGLQDNGEAGTSGVTVALVDPNGNVVGSTTTSSTGNYGFDVAPGSYSIKVSLPSDYLATVKDANGNASDATDSDIDATGKSGLFFVGSGQTNNTIDAGLVPIRTASIGDKVWMDANGNGVQDNGEAGASGVTVSLCDANGSVLATQATNASGSYLFNNLAKGTYSVKFTAPSGYQFTTQDAGGNDAVDSDAAVSTGKTANYTLATGQQNLTVDAGLTPVVVKNCAVGDRVWHDWNHTWLQDDQGESGVAGVRVTLLDGSGKVVASMSTDSSGHYLFSNLAPGTYQLQFDKKNVMFTDGTFQPAANMSNWFWGVKDVGSNDAIDSDVAGDGKTHNDVTLTDKFTLVAGQTDLTRDACITPLVLDLDGNGIHTVSRAGSGNFFDMFGDGHAVASGWVSGGDGLLAVDSNGNGRIDDIHELFGGTAKGAGYARLAAFDSNRDGLVDDLDSNFGQLMIWRDANGNHQTDAGELMTLSQAGVASLAVAHSHTMVLDAQGNVLGETSSATLASGASVTMTDVYFNVSAEDAMTAGVPLPTVAELLSNDAELDRALGAGDAAPATALPAAAVPHGGSDQGVDGGGEAADTIRRFTALHHDHPPCAAA